jgi:hypothetical protein
VAVFAVCAIALLGIAAADAQPFTPQQLTVTVANGTATSGGNSIFVVPLGTNSSLITNTATPINTDRAQVGAIDALAWLPTGSQAALALAAADVKRRTILLYPNLASYPSPNYGVSTPLYVPLPVGKPCSGVPNALSVDAAGDIFYVTSDPAVCVLPATGPGTWGAPVVIDHKCGGVLSALLSDTLVATVATPSFGVGDLVVLDGTLGRPRILVYSRAQIVPFLNTNAPPPSPLSGPTSVLVSPLQFKKAGIAVPTGVDFLPQDLTLSPHANLVASTAGGDLRLVDLTTQAIVTTPLARNLLSGSLSFLGKVKVGVVGGANQVLVARVAPWGGANAILQLGGPAVNGAYSVLATATTDINVPLGLALTTSGTVQASSCIGPPGCSPIGPQTNLQLSGPGVVNIPAGATITQQLCLITDPRVSVVDGVWSCNNPEYINSCGEEPTPGCIPQTLDISTLCPAFPSTVLPATLCAHAGATGNTAAVMLESANQVDQVANNIIFQSTLDPNVTLPGPYNLPCSAFPSIAYATNSNDQSVEGPTGPGNANTFIDFPGLCEPAAGLGHSASVFSWGLMLDLSQYPGGLAAYVGNLYTPVSAVIEQATEPQNNQIDPGVASTLTTQLGQSQAYLAAGNYNCFLNSVAGTINFLQSTLHSNPGDFRTGQPVPVGLLDVYDSLWALITNIYYRGLQLDGLPPNTTQPPTNVPACNASVLNQPTGLAFNSNGNLSVANYGSGQILVYAPTGPNGQLVYQPSQTLGGFTNPVRLAFAPITTYSNISGDLIVADVGTNTVSVYNGSTLSGTISGITRPLGVAADAYGYIYFAENEGSGNGGEGSGNVNDIQVYSSSEGLSPYAAYVRDSNGLQFQSVGALAYNGSDILVGLPTEVVFYNTSQLASSCGSCLPTPDGNQTPITSDVNGIVGIAVDANNHVYVSNYYAGGATPPVAQFTAFTGQPTSLTLTGTPNPPISNPQGVAVDAAGNIYVSNTANNLIYVYNSSGVYQYTIH